MDLSQAKKPHIHIYYTKFAISTPETAKKCYWEKKMTSNRIKLPSI
jgi:hypothetical protein